MNSKENFETVEQITRMKIVCSRIFKDQKDFDSIRELKNLISNSRPTNVKTVEPIIFSVFYPILKTISESISSFKEKEKQLIVDTFRVFFEKITIEKLALFFNIYGFLLFEVYDHKNHLVLNISEEYKLNIVECMTALVKCLSFSATEELYVKDNAPKLCQMVYVLLQLSKNEDFRTLRISAINCIMAIAHVLDDNDLNDVTIRNQIAEIFLFFLPGVATQLKSVALVDEKFGHKIPSVALKAWGRIVALLMQDYSAFDRKINLKQVSLETKSKFISKNRWKDENELKEYIKNTQRSPEWYAETDQNLQQIVVEFTKLTHHSHHLVRLELVNTASMLIENCVHTMPKTVTCLVNIIITLSEDVDSSVSERSKDILVGLSEKLTEEDFKDLLDSLEESFYSLIISMPRKFNGIDEKVQIVALNSLIGHIHLFGKHNLTNILHSTVHLNRLLKTLIHISEFDKSHLVTLEDSSISEYDLSENFKTPWKKFRYFQEDLVLKKLETVCHLLGQHGTTEIIADFLFDVLSDPEQRKQAFFLLNEVLAGTKPNERNVNFFKNFIQIYTEGSNWYLPLSVMIDDYGYEHTLNDVRNNVIQVCLLVEGIGKAAVNLGKDFQQFMLKTLYLVLERAGSAHPIVRTSGLLALSNISTACQFSSVTDLITNNVDYLTFHVERKLNRAKGDEGGLNILAVVIKYSSKEVLNMTCGVVRQLLIRVNRNTPNIDSFLRVFQMFLLALHKWFEITSVNEAFKTKKQKQDEFQEFQVSNIEPIEDFSDEIMEKSAEEMYQEDMQKSKEEIDELNEAPEEEYKKPKPPLHIELTVSILSKSLHFLPSKSPTRKLLVLDILKNGVPVLKEWEDELLPIVHQIWSPLVDRFIESDVLIVNYSFQLLIVLAKTSKEFIRSRTVKEVLPNILKILDKLAEESYLKDVGSAYRFSQNYKLQMMILENLWRVVTDLDFLEEDTYKTMQVVFKYLSDKQPIPLQKSAVYFFEMLIKYDPPTISQRIRALKDISSEYEKNISALTNLLDE